MESIKKFLQRKNIVFSAKRYGIDALGAMAQGLFCSLLIGTILNTLGSQFHIDFLTAQIAEKVPYTVGGLTSFMSGPAMAIAIGYALQAPPLVLFSLAAVGYAVRLSARKPRLTFWSRPLSPPSSASARPTSLRRPSARRPAHSVRSSCRPRRSSPS